CLLWGSRVVVPPPLRKQVLGALHKTHPGIVRMKALARSYVWWPGMDEEIEGWVQGCKACQESRPDLPSAPAQSWEAHRKPWSRLHIDFAGPFQDKYFFILVDAYTKWFEVIPVASTSMAAAIRELRRVLCIHGIPDTIVSDNGTAFTSREFRESMQRYLIQHIRSTPFHPTTNGQAERMVRTTKEALGRIVQRDWDHRLATFLFDNRITPNPVTGVSPAELLMGRKLITRLDRLHPDQASDIHSSPEIREAARGFFPGDPVYARNYANGPEWVEGRVLRVIGSLHYNVSMEGGRILRRHIDQIRRRTLPEELAEMRCEEELTTAPPPPRSTLTQPTAPANRGVEPNRSESHLQGAGVPEELQGADNHRPVTFPRGETAAPSATEAGPPGAQATAPTSPTIPRRSTRERTAPAYLWDYVS
ncbi:LOW QUALITY PROTEIN: uncharacterized protein K02A2.6-like, partial [Heteronotia binoei]|uniref:LOW QUALITY PROTEIN: uncharacterized protein K02A2.6-like n=1 Tax=Heteronotia binoei TaxID=13085 RepID=UPI00292E60B7